MNKFLIALLACSASLAAQDNPLSASIKLQYNLAKGAVIKAADKMPDTNYSFKATDEVRSFAQLIGHVADAQYSFCSPVLGEKSPNTGSIEKGKTTKADLVKALADAFAYCDKAYDTMTDTIAIEPIKFFGRDNPKLGILAFNNMHIYEHYGNVVTYMRLKNIVPPTSKPRPQTKK